MGRIAVAGTVVLVMMVIGAGSAAAAPAWLPAEKPFGDTESELATATMSPDGTVTDARLLPAGGGQYTLEARTRPPGGSFGPTQTIDTAVTGSVPVLLSGTDGTVAVVYPKGVEAWAAIRPPGGVFGPPRLLSPGNPSLERLAVDGAGRVWFVHEGAGLGSVVASVLGSSGPAVDLLVEAAPAGAEVRSPSVSVSPAGEVRAAYQFFTPAKSPGCQQLYELREADGGVGGFAPSSLLATTVATGTGPTCNLVSGEAMATARIATTGDGATVVVYGVGSFSTPTAVVLARYRPAGGAWPPFGSPAETVGNAGLPEPSVVGAGATPVVAIRDLVGARTIAVSSRNPDGSWTPPKAVNSGEVGTPPRLASSPSGAAIVAWKQLLSPYRIQAVTYSSATGFSSPVFVSDVQDSAASLGGAGMDDQGNGVVGWSTHVGAEPTTGFRAMVAGYDGAGPRFTELDVPASGFVGESLRFSAGAVDVWSTIPGPPGWQFGDGVGAQGGSVSHTYGGVGSYTVSTSVADALGNTTTAQRSLAVTPAPSGGGNGGGGSSGSPGSASTNSNPAAKDTTRPTLSNLRLSAQKVVKGKAAKLTFTLSEPATLRVTVDRRAPGVKKGSKCVKPQPKAKQGGKSCRRLVTVKTLSGSFGAGAGSLPLPRTLAAGGYEVRAVATDPAGNQSPPAAGTLTVVKPAGP